MKNSTIKIKNKNNKQLKYNISILKDLFLENVKEEERQILDGAVAVGGVYVQLICSCLAFIKRRFKERN